METSNLNTSKSKLLLNRTLVQIPGPLVTGIFKARPNRYVAEVVVENVQQTVHVHDPGRLRELLFTDNQCMIRYAASETRKTDWDMIAAYKEIANGFEYVLIHSGYHRAVAQAILSDPELSPFGAHLGMRAEVTYGHSRIDFVLDMPQRNTVEASIQSEPLWIEVKGCSLSEGDVAKFPDAPTVRGTKHLKTLMTLKESGARAAVLMLVFSAATHFEPKADTDPVFAQTFYAAQEVGVEIHAVRVWLDPEKGTLNYGGEIPIG